MTNLTSIPVVTLYVAKTGHRQFTATVAFKPAPGGYLVSDVVGKRTTAIKNLEQKLRVFGVNTLPTWNVQDVGTVQTPASEPETPAAPAPEPAPVHDTIPAPPPVEVEAADLAEQAIEDSKVEAAAIAAPRMDGGFVTPLSDKAAWAKVYLATIAKFDGLEWPGENPREKIQNFREAVGLVMNSVGYATPWTWWTEINEGSAKQPQIRRVQHGQCAVGGENYIRFSGCVDPTIRQPRHTRAAVGAQGQAVDPRGQWDLSGKNAPRLAPAPKPERALGNGLTVKLGRFGAYVSLVRIDGTVNASLPKSVTFESCTVQDAEAAIARKLGKAAPAAKPETKGAPAAKPEKNATSYVPVTDADKAAYRVAFKTAAAWSADARAKGNDSNLYYKLGMCITLRSLGATPHAKHEASLLEKHNITAEWLANKASQKAAA